MKGYQTQRDKFEHSFKTYMIALLVIASFLWCVSDASAAVKYTSYGVPTNVDTSFKTYMDWRAITSKSSPQYKLTRQHGWCDENGFMRVTRDNDIPEDYYMIALGSYYGTEIGTKYRITLSTGNVFYGILSDQKADRHTNSTHQYASNNDVVEFLVDTRYLNRTVKKMGSAGVFEPLRGTVVAIERIDIVPDPESVLAKEVKPLDYCHLEAICKKLDDIKRYFITNLLNRGV